MDEPKVNKELEDIAPELIDKKVTDGFDVPPDYFRDLHSRIMTRVADEGQPNEAKRVRLLSTRASRMRVIGVAVAACALVLVVFVFMQGNQSQSDLTAVITAEEAFDYVYENIYEYNTDDLLSLLDNETEIYEYDELSNEELNYMLEDLLKDVGPEQLEDLF